jgi:hypothetical protein
MGVILKFILIIAFYMSIFTCFIIDYQQIDPLMFQCGIACYFFIILSLGTLVIRVLVNQFNSENKLEMKFSEFFS